MAFLSIKTRFDPTPYDLKIAQLHSKVEEEAIRLQGILESKENSLREIKLLGERSERIVKETAILENKQTEAQKALDEVLERKNNFLVSIKNESKREKDFLKDLQKENKLLVARLEELKSINYEINQFISKETEARTHYLDQKRELEEVRAEREKILGEIEKDKKYILTWKLKADKSKKDIADMMSKLSNYAFEVSRATKVLNKKLANNKVPLRFGLPPDKITEIPFQ